MGWILLIIHTTQSSAFVVRSQLRRYVSIFRCF